MANERTLTPDELFDITGYVYPSKQCEALRLSGIPFIRRRDGRPGVTWSIVNTALCGGSRGTSVADEEQPNFDAM